GVLMFNLPLYLCNDDSAQDISEYAVMLAVILVIVDGTNRLVGSNANNVFSSVASSVQLLANRFHPEHVMKPVCAQNKAAGQTALLLPRARTLKDVERS